MPFFLFRLYLRLPNLILDLLAKPCQTAPMREPRDSTQLVNIEQAAQILRDGHVLAMPLKPFTGSRAMRRAMTRCSKYSKPKPARASIH